MPRILRAGQAVSVPPPLRGGHFVVCYNDNTVFLVTDALGETGSILIPQSNVNVGLPNTADLINMQPQIVGTNPWSFYHSDTTTDWVEITTIAITRFRNDVNNHIFGQDLTKTSTPAVYVAHYKQKIGSTPDAPTYFSVSSDGGNFWNAAITLQSIPSFYVFSSGQGVARHDNSTGFVWFNVKLASSNTWNMQINLVDTTGASTQRSLADGCWGDESVRGTPEYSAVRSNDSDNLYIVASNLVKGVWQYTWSTDALGYLGDLSSWTGGARCMIPTRQGTLLVVISDATHFNIVRTTNGFSTANAYDAIANGLIPSTRANVGADQIVIDYDNTLFIPIEQQSIGTGGFALVSTDDGVTWSKTSNFLYGSNSALTIVDDVGGAGRAS